VSEANPLERVTVPRVVAHAANCDTVTAAFIGALRWEAGPLAAELQVSRGRDRRAWNRQIGEQTVNVCIVLSVIPVLLSGLLFWFARAAVGPDLPVWVTVLCWVPVALAIGGLVVAYLERHAWAAWTDEDVSNSLARASRLRTRQALVAGAVLALVGVATGAGWF